MAKPAPVIILGMHRSGTSCLAGCLEEAGLYLGDVNTEAPFNKKGNRENRQIMELYDQVLARVNASWNSPPITPPVWQDNELASLQAHIDNFPTDQVWGTKDPRALFMLDAWFKLAKPNFIGTFRHPAEVTASLCHRAELWGQPMRETDALDLWAIYNQALINHYKAHPFHVIRYDIPYENYHEKLTLAGQSLGLSIPNTLQFRTPELHNQKADTPIPQHLHPIWETLNAIAL